jgi:predicted GH43/DUF377 family glycosyl hydrolase
MRLVTRYEKNPILTRDDIPYPVETVHNAGVIKHGDRYVMVFRSHRHSGRSVLGIAESDDGFQFRVRPEPFMVPATEEPFAEYEAFGIEDPRICLLDGAFYITYSAYSRHGVRIGLARTDDFESVTRIEFISPCDMRNVVLFPERLNGDYVRLERPHTEISPWSIWLSRSTDLVHWGRSKRILSPLPYHWDEMKVGPGATPIRTERGWLNIFHGVFSTMSGSVYRLGVALHDLNEPERLLGVADEWILAPESPWERSGYVNNVVFTCGAVPEPDGSLKLYWGAADTVMCVGTARMDELVDRCLAHSRPALG